MEITLNDDDVRTLRALLRDYLPALRFEAARSDPGELRHALITRQNLCERLLAELSDVTGNSCAR